MTETCGEGMTGNIEKRIVEGEYRLRLYHCACVLLIIVVAIVVKDSLITEKSLLKTAMVVARWPGVKLLFGRSHCRKSRTAASDY